MNISVRIYIRKVRAKNKGPKSYGATFRPVVTKRVPLSMHRDFDVVLLEVKENA
jgi:hypothetical protein